MDRIKAQVQRGLVLFVAIGGRIMPIILKKHGFNIDEYEETEEKK